MKSTLAHAVFLVQRVNGRVVSVLAEALLEMDSAGILAGSRLVA